MVMVVCVLDSVGSLINIVEGVVRGVVSSECSDWPCL